MVVACVRGPMQALGRLDDQRALLIKLCGGPRPPRICASNSFNTPYPLDSLEGYDNYRGRSAPVSLIETMPPRFDPNVHWRR